MGPGRRPGRKEPGLRPVIPIETAILHGLGDVLGGDALGAGHVGDGAGDFENAVVRPGRQAHAANGHLKRPLAGIIERALFADQPRRHMRVVVAAGVLNAARSFHARADLRRTLAARVAAQFLVRHGGHLHVDIDAVEQRPADLAEVALDQRGGAAAFARGIAIEAAAAGINVSNPV